MNNRFEKLTINDVIDNAEGVTVRGMQFDAEFNVVLIKKPYTGIEIDWQEIGSISVIVNGTYLLLDQTQLKNGQHSLYNDILTALEKKALQIANNTPDYKWEVMEYAV